jgi:hypothetical protein
MKTCLEFFNNNVYDAFQELLYQGICTFIYIWHFGHNNLVLQFEKNMDLLYSKSMRGYRSGTIFMYQNLFV